MSNTEQGEIKISKEMGAEFLKNVSDMFELLNWADEELDSKMPAASPIVVFGTSDRAKAAGDLYARIVKGGDQDAADAFIAVVANLAYKRGVDSVLAAAKTAAKPESD